MARKTIFTSIHIIIHQQGHMMIPVSKSLSQTYFIATVNSVWRESQGTVQESILLSTIPGSVQETVLSTVPGSVNSSRVALCSIMCNPNCDPTGSNILRITIGIDHPEDHSDAISIVSGLFRTPEDCSGSRRLQRITQEPTISLQLNHYRSSWPTASLWLILE